MQPRFLALAGACALTAIPAIAQTYPPPPPALEAPPPALRASPTGARPGNEIGTGQSLPTSARSSNITPGDTRSVIAPRLPTPPLDENAPPFAFLASARQALAAGRTGEGQEALERAESRALDRSVRPSQAGQASRQSLVHEIAQAREALAAGDGSRTIELIAIAMENPEARERRR